MGKRTILLAGLALLVAPAVLAQSKVGTTAATFLEVGVGARNIGLGEAAVSMVDDVTSLYWNPAGIARMPASQFTFQYTDWFADTRLQFVAGAVKAGSLGTVGLHFYGFNSGEMDVRTIEFEDGTGETFSVQDLSLGVSLARSLTPSFSLGATAKLVQSRIWRMRASSIAVDVGVLYDMPVPGLRLGFAITNFGAEMRLAGDNTTVRVDLDPLTAGDNDGILANLGVQAWDLPLLFRIGLSYEVLRSASSRLVVAADASYPNSNTQFVNTGAEYAFMNVFFVRGGWSNLFLDEASGRGHLRLGFGINAADRVRVDYAFADRGDLGGVNTIGASVRF